ncbi:hypothetical protein OG496_51400 [Streptomyces sp. NBC_00988]|uniref:hypothetical protein n=1 Tax=Streptomyces sp. NBC_00988 TaxID=2903704 RepID=UPI00386E4C53|nr:hypothetical protein OG496_51400 [Streptomyces sp. NBC_00988]
MAASGVSPFATAATAITDDAARAAEGEFTVIDRDQERSDDRPHPESPWWWGLGPIGAVGLVVLGIAAVVWSFLHLPGTAENQATDYYRASRIVAIGLVVAGTALLGRIRTRGSDKKATREHEAA